MSAEVAGLVPSPHRRPVVLRPLPEVPGAAATAEDIPSQEAFTKLTDNLKNYDAAQRANEMRYRGRP